MEKEVDVIVLCQKLIELTKEEKCDWRETSEKDRYRLNLPSGSIEINAVFPSEFDFLSKTHYVIYLYDNKRNMFASYDESNSISERFKVFSELYHEIVEILESKKRRKISVLFDDLVSTSYEHTES